jgi:hypothetical protein
VLPPPKKTNRRCSTAGARELRLKARPPARFSSQSVSKELTTINNKETKTTVPSGNSYFWHIESPQIPFSGNSYFWRTARRRTMQKMQLKDLTPHVGAATFVFAQGNRAEFVIENGFWGTSMF